MPTTLCECVVREDTGEKEIIIMQKVFKARKPLTYSQHSACSSKLGLEDLSDGLLLLNYSHPDSMS